MKAPRPTLWQSLLLSQVQQAFRRVRVAHYRSAQELIASPHKPDAAIVCAPNHTHVTLAKELSAAGVHILVENPVSVDIASGRGLIEFLKDTQVKALVGHHRRFNPYVVAAK